MKIFYVIIGVLLFQNSYSQTQIDEIFSINIPNGFEKNENFQGISISEKHKEFIDKLKIETYTLNNENKDFYLLIKTTYLDKENKIYGYSPENPNELFEFYSQYSKKIISVLHKKGSVFRESVSFKIENLIGRTLIFEDSLSKKQNAEAKLIQINGNTYFTAYSKISEFNEHRKNEYLNSLKISEPQKQKQIEASTNIIYSIFKFIFLVVLLIVLYKFKKKK